MKSVFIVFNQANTERVEYMLDMLKISGFTFFEQVQGRGTNGGEPRRGTHTWPEMNSAVMTVVEDEQVPELLSVIKRLDMRNPQVGVRAFVWNIEMCVQSHTSLYVKIESAFSESARFFVLEYKFQAKQGE